nr:MAG TPA: hypothetical protein [Caudoviricetes sp.]
MLILTTNVFSAILSKTVDFQYDARSFPESIERISCST